MLDRENAYDEGILNIIGYRHKKWHVRSKHYLKRKSRNDDVWCFLALFIPLNTSGKLWLCSDVIRISRTNLVGGNPLIWLHALQLIICNKKCSKILIIVLRKKSHPASLPFRTIKKKDIFYHKFHIYSK